MQCSVFTSYRCKDTRMFALELVLKWLGCSGANQALSASS